MSARPPLAEGKSTPSAPRYVNQRPFGLSPSLHASLYRLPRADHADDSERDTPPVRQGLAGMGCAIGQDHVTLGPASLAVGLGAVGRG
jgi:hypothetical protein